MRLSKNKLWHSRPRLCRIAQDSRGRLSHKLQSYSWTPTMLVWRRSMQSNQPPVGRSAAESGSRLGATAAPWSLRSRFAILSCQTMVTVRRGLSWGDESDRSNRGSIASSCVPLGTRWPPNGAAVLSAQGNALGTEAPTACLSAQWANCSLGERLARWAGRKGSADHSSPGRCPGLEERSGLRPNNQTEMETRDANQQRIDGGLVPKIAWRRCGCAASHP
jgi:hypothetical protein